MITTPLVKRFSSETVTEVALGFGYQLALQYVGGAMSELLNVATVAAVLKCSPDTVIRRFSKIKGVVNLGTEETLGKRKYSVIRIPKHILEKFIGHPVEIVPTVQKPKRQKNWKDQAARSLAKAIKLNADDPQNRELFKEIQDHARMLTFVDEEEWAQVVFIARGECDELGEEANES